MSAELTAELITDLWTPTGPDISPDGHRVAWSAAPRGRASEHRGDAIFVAPFDVGSPARRFTHIAAAWSPRWSPDGTRLAFLSDRPTGDGDRNEAGIYVAYVDGGEAEPVVVRRKRGVETFRWSPGGTRLAFLAPDPQTEADDKREEDRDDAQIRGESWHPHRLWLVATGDGEDRSAAAFTAADRHVIDLAWAPSGDRIAILWCDSPELDDRARAELAVVDVPATRDDGETPTRPEPVRLADAGFCGALAWIGDRILMCGPHRPDPASAYTVRTVDPSTGGRAVAGPDANAARCAIGLAPVAGSDCAVVTVAEGVRTSVETLDPSSGRWEVCWAPDADVDGVTAVNVDGTLILAAVSASRTAPEEVYAGAGGVPHPISAHGRPLDGIAFGRVEDATWTSTDGLTIDGILIRPVTDRPGPYPLVVLPHGGPYGRSGRSLHLGWGNWGQWLATAGYAVLLPNYRGGLGHGDRFAALARAAVGGDEVDDVLTGVDAMVDAGVADPAALGIGGWSQGGFLTASLITRTDRFKAAVMGAGVSDWLGMTLAGDLPTFEGALVGGWPWEPAGWAAAARRSPISHADRVHTPTLVLHGERDARVPLAQGTGFAWALRRHGVPVRQVVLPREPHGITERAHQLTVLAEVRRWYAEHLPVDSAGHAS